MLKWNVNPDREHVYRDIVSVGSTGRFVVVDSRETMDTGYETMVFEAEGNGDVIDYSDLDVRRYETWQEMETGHKEIVEKWKKKEDLTCIWEEIFGSSDE